MNHAELIALRHANWRGLGGRRLDKMLDDREHTVECLGDPSPDIRFLAVSLLDEHFKCLGDFQSQLENLANADSDGKVRRVAKFALAKVYRGRNDEIARRLIAENVVDTTSDDEEQLAYYGYLIMLTGDYSAFVTNTEQIDWELVRRYATQT
jgi:hypothetical protein